MTSAETQYLYCINDVDDEDFITTSFSYFNKDSRGKGGIHIFNFNQNYDISKVSYVAIDYTSDPFLFDRNKYRNSNALRIFIVEFVSQDIDRMMVTLSILEEIKTFDLLSYKREVKIKNIFK